MPDEPDRDWVAAPAAEPATEVAPVNSDPTPESEPAAKLTLDVRACPICSRAIVQDSCPFCGCELAQLSAD